MFKSGVINCGISDSVYMIKKLRVPTPKLPPRTLSVRNLKKFDLKSFRKELMEVPFDQIKNVTNDVNEMWLIWKAFFLDLLNKHAPITNIKVRNNKLPYVTFELRKLIRQRDYLRAKANKTGSEYIRQAFNHLRSKVNYELNHAKRNYYTRKTEQHKDNLKLTWKVLKHAIGEGGSSISAIENLELDDDIISDSKKILGNYRPISVLPTVARIFEKLVYDQMYAYFLNNDLLGDRQFGFRSLHSTALALSKVTNTWLLNLDSDRMSSVVLLDIQKAFDTVDHQILLDKLRCYGVSGDQLVFFASYLNNRQQCCNVNGKLSSTKRIRCGVGPFTFYYIHE